MRMVHGLKTLLSRLSFLLIFLISFSLSAKTLKVDTVTPSVTNGDFTITPNGTGDIVLGTFSGVLKSSTGVVSVGNVNLTSEVTGTLPEENGGTGVTDMATILVEILGTQTISGVKTFSSDILMSGTGQIDIPVGTTAQRSGSPNTGMIRYNSTTSSYEGYAGTDWAALGGGGGGGSLLNLIIDPSFETGVTEGTCTTCTATSEATIVELTDLNAKSLKMAFSASAGDYTDTTTTSSQYAGVVGKASARCKTDQEGIEFCSMVDGAESACVEVSSGDIWDTYAVNSTMSSTSFGYKIVARNSITGNVYCDEIFAGSNPIETVVTQGQSEYYNAIIQTNFWDASGGITTFDTSLIPLTNSSLLQWNDTTETRLEALNTCVVDVTVHGTATANNNVSIRDSSGNDLVKFEAAGITAIDTTISVLLQKGDYIYFRLSSAVNRDGGLTITATPQSNKAVMVSVDDDSMTDSVAYTPTLAGFGTTSTVDFFWKRDGEDIVISGNAIFSGTGSAANASFTLPTGLTFDTAKIPTGGMAMGSAGWYDASAAQEYVARVIPSTPNLIMVVPHAGGTNALQGTEVAASDYMRIEFRAPIVGWSATPTAMIAVPVEENKAESYIALRQSNFWDATGLTNDFLISGGSNADNPVFIVEDSGGLTRVRAKVNMEATISCGGNSSANTGPKVFNSSGVEMHRNEISTGTLSAGVSYTVVIAKDDWIYCQIDSSDRAGQLTVTAQPANLKVFLGNVNPTEFVKTIGAVKPVEYSARVTDGAATTTISHEIGTFINGVCTNPSLGEYVCTFETGAFSDVNCRADVYSSANNSKCNAHSTTSASTGVTCRVVGGATDAQIDIDFTLFCHGVQ